MELMHIHTHASQGSGNEGGTIMDPNRSVPCLPAILKTSVCRNTSRCDTPKSCSHPPLSRKSLRPHPHARSEPQNTTALCYLACRTKTSEQGHTSCYTLPVPETQQNQMHVSAAVAQIYPTVSTADRKQLFGHDAINSWLDVALHSLMHCVWNTCAQANAVSTSSAANATRPPFPKSNEWIVRANAEQYC